MLPFYPFYWSDYSSKTFDLTMEQHGAYLLFLRHIYTTGQPIPNKYCFSIARAMTEQQKKDAMFVLEKFFTLDGENWRNLRAEEVINEQNIKHKKRVEAGRSGGVAKSEASLKKRSSNARGKLGQNSSNQNQSQNVEKERDKSLSKNEFQKPTLEEISKYCQERENSVNPQQFFNFYESKGWLIGKSPMKDWKAAIGSWEQGNQERQPRQNRSSDEKNFKLKYINLKALKEKLAV